jgi:hypothetical protein
MVTVLPRNERQRPERTRRASVVVTSAQPSWRVRYGWQIGLLVAGGTVVWLLADSNAAWWVVAAAVLAINILYASAMVTFFVFWHRSHGP